MINKERNLSLLMDYYELTMANAFFKNGQQDTIAHFDLYFRKAPDDAVFAIATGLDTAIEYIENLHFSDEEIEFLRKKNIFCEEFLEYLRNFKFECDVRAIREGSVVFPNEPLITVRGPFIQALLLETMLLLIINHQTMIATKANRIVRYSQGRTIMEFGSRRAHGPDAANLGARAAYISGVVGSANTLTDYAYGIPALGTMAHSWVQSFDSEYEAFKVYAETYPDNTVLLIDTYDTLRHGLPNAIKCFDEVLKPLGKRPKGVRLDSGDLAYLSKKARIMLDEAGYEDCPIVASSSLDEFKIKDIIDQGGKIDSFGVGEKLITAESNPVFGGVYKLVAIERDGEVIPRIKISENIEKITTPGIKQVYRIYDQETNKAKADLITLSHETINEDEPLTIFHPLYTWKRKTINNFYTKPLLVPIYEKGKLVYDRPSLNEIKEYCKEEIESLWEEYKRLDQPQLYKVDLSQELWDLKHNLLNQAKNNN
ncbi:nicotinate phosphoribosyltransferase [Helcococcus kunzii]|uniref:Nicotinate phosphoribosyltransferase n=1 Tax=Helcococcus kunzii ATCC 51366 TaxID=883114 RepID=H3NL20_9FIRM|nr:nicotinate phosphoribosyltransferase [Helcococcus kunzii]EHR36276.1 putative nicotinate phosphoribosyltransferase [Helcococcus kunzii ATCC 51366]MCT1797019.1 nicotinate phosphoribosyltransferase [Helcococcus kunzii]MCT1988424.1 nicotinate phosphoribosyltransferase [Helcococcus kunzii]QUY65720.1 nicotinate phosphoribosyltransferase [Helcococcus kunzii]QZO76437.1 nicotinate phosphoribosyltransferase [Helcococcus kunzii]